MSSFAQRYSDNSKQKLASVPSKMARWYLCKFGYSSSSLLLPEYFNNFEFSKLKLLPINWSSGNSLKRTLPLTIFAPKGDLAWRRFSLLHPYAYWHVMDTISDPTNWEEIKKKLTQKSLVNSYSLPVFENKHPTVQGLAIETWLKFAEQDLVNDSVDYSVLVLTDIRDFYQSIYTHSIAWALHGKDSIKEKMRHRDKKLWLGEKLDKLFQNSRGGQTNGIPVGNMASDIIAEIILTDIDMKLSNKLSKEKPKMQFLASRYRDDYRFLCKSKTSADYIIKAFNRILHDEYDLMINPDKTKIYDDIVLNFRRPSALSIDDSQILNKLEHDQLGNNLLADVIFEAYRLQKQFPENRPSITILEKLYEKLEKSMFTIQVNDSMYRIVALLIKLMAVKEDAIPYIVVLLDRVFNNLLKKEVESIVLRIQEETENYPDKEFLLIWLHRLVMHHIPKKCNKLFKKYTDLPLISILLDPKHDSLKFYSKISINKIETSDLKQLSQFKLVEKDLLTKTSGKKLEPIQIFEY